MAGALETLRQNVAALSATSPVGVEIMREARGDYRGETVQASSAASKLQDAAEEIGMSVAHRADRRSLGQRQVRQGQGATFDSLARIADQADKLPDMPREQELQGLVEELLQFQDLLNGGGHGRPGKDDVLALLGRLDPDPTHQFASLSFAAEYLRSAGASDALLDLVDSALDEYGKGDLGRDVRAGFAAAEIAHRQAATLETDPAQVREVYREMLRENPNLGQLFDLVTRFDVLKSFAETVDSFMEIAGRDMASTGPSTDPVFLHGLVTELGKLKKMKTVVEMSDALARSTDRLLQPGETPKGDAVDVSRQVLLFAGRASAALPDAQALLQRYDECSVATQLAFANGLRGLHGELPDDAMPSGAARLQQAATIVSLLDALALAEEQEYEAGAAA